jgi:hypothetical protein
VTANDTTVLTVLRHRAPQSTAKAAIATQRTFEIAIFVVQATIANPQVPKHVLQRNRLVVKLLLNSQLHDLRR